MGAAEKDVRFQEVILENNKKRLSHLYPSIEAMLADEPCILAHDGTQHGQQCKCCAGISPSLAMTGSPCNPYSTQRAKRFLDGSVANHPLATVTMTGVVEFYLKFEPKLGIMEQVKGFMKRTSHTDMETPCDRQGCNF